jgi:hypothetical protein
MHIQERRIANRAKADYEYAGGVAAAVVMKTDGRDLDAATLTELRKCGGRGSAVGRKSGACNSGLGC